MSPSSVPRGITVYGNPSPRLLCQVESSHLADCSIQRTSCSRAVSCQPSSQTSGCFGCARSCWEHRLGSSVGTFSPCRQSARHNWRCCLRHLSNDLDFDGVVYKLCHRFPVPRLCHRLSCAKRHYCYLCCRRLNVDLSHHVYIIVLVSVNFRSSDLVLDCG